MCSIKNHRDEKWNGGCQRVGGGKNEVLVINRYTVPVSQEEKSFRDGWWWYLQNNVNLRNATGLYT